MKVLVTGASRGIGRAVALAFARESDAEVAIICKDNYELLNETCVACEDSGARAKGYLCDISHRAEFASTMDEILDEFGSFDVVVHSAGVISRDLFDKVKMDDWDQVMNTNLTSVVMLLQYVLPGMRRNSYGRIVNISSQMAYIPHPAAAPSYEASKAGLTALTRHLALREAPYGITVNAVAPGSIDTDMPKNMSAEQRLSLERSIPVGRLGRPDEVAAAVRYLASKQAAYITGTTIHVNGGSLML